MNGLELLIDELKKEIESQKNDLASTFFTEQQSYMKKFFTLRGLEHARERAVDIYNRLASQ